MLVTRGATLRRLEKTRSNLYKANGKYYRLFGTGITDNGCWVLNPKMVELKDIDVASGRDVYGEEIIFSDVAGTVSSGNAYMANAGK